MIYLDNNATTFLDGAVREEMSRFLHSDFGNPSSIHRFGQRAKHLLFSSQRTIASFFGVSEREVFFTSGATEALNMVLTGFSKKGRILTSTLEHPAVLEPLLRQEKKGRPVTFLSPAERKGSLTFQQIQESVTPDTTLIVLMAANNETGVRTEIEEIASFAQARGIYFVVDGVALLGKEPFKLPQGVSAICFSGHKIHGPTGIGLAIVRNSFPFDPLILGGPQQLGKRGGTENLLAICGMAKAISILQALPLESFSRMERLRIRFEEGVCAYFSGAYVHGSAERRISNTTHLCFPTHDGEALLMQLDLAGIAASHGSACSSGGLTPSRVLLNMGVSNQEARSSIRFSLSRMTTEEDITQALEIIYQISKKPLFAALQGQVPALSSG